MRCSDNLMLIAYGALCLCYVTSCFIGSPVVLLWLSCGFIMCRGKHIVAGGSPVLLLQLTVVSCGSPFVHVTSLGLSMVSCGYPMRV